MDLIGKINGLKLELDLKKGALETDIKSLKKAARQTVGPELERRIEIIIETSLIELDDDFKIYWEKSPIGKLITGRDYLNPKIELLVDDILEQSLRKKLIIFLEKWLKNKIDTILKSLVDLKDLKEKNSSVKALAYQLYENNGVLKRDQVSEYLKNLGQNERKILRDLGVRFGRYHIFLHKLIKPEPVTIRTLLWKNYHLKYFKLKPPTFGLNFIDDTNNRNKNFMLLCGFEKFDNLFVRIDILERLFVQIINSNSKKEKEVKMVPEMLNLLGCSKENFFNEAKNLFENGKIEESKFLFQRNIVFNPKDAKSYLYLAKIYNYEEDQRKEEYNLDTALLIEPNNEEAILMLMKIALKKSNYSKVKDLSETFVKVCKKLCDENDEIQESLKNIEPKNES